MVNQPMDAPITRREFYMELMVVWLFILLTSTARIGSDSGWTSLLIPVGALAILALHAVALARGSRSPSSTTRQGGGAPR